MSTIGKSQTTNAAQSNLSKQDLSTLDITRLTPLSPEVISRQATINIGTIGHVAHGKSTVVKAVSGVQTVRFKHELERNITIKLDKNCNGYRRKYKRLKVNGSKSNDKSIEYEVESILSHSEYNGRATRYLVKWKGWSQADSTWEPFENLTGCIDLLVEYYERKLHPFVANINSFECYQGRYLAYRSRLTNFEPNELEGMCRYVLKDKKGVEMPNEEEVDDKVQLLARLPPQARDANMENQIRFSLLLLKFQKKRNKQLIALKKWEDEINNIMDPRNAPLKVENEVDLAGPPDFFVYVENYIAGQNIVIPSEPFIGCNCSTVCDKITCHTSHGSYRNYKNGLLVAPSGSPIFECNKSCKCDDNCGNRVIQRGRTFPLIIFRTSYGCGWGVKTTVPIPKGSFVSTYSGEVITFKEAERRGMIYDKEGSTYLFDLDFNDATNFPYTVDAKSYGNVSHFINHSCNPNLTVFAAWINCLDPNMPLLVLFAVKNIKAGDELTFDYLCQPVKKNTIRNQSKINYLCKCRSSNCRKYLF